MLAAGHMHVCVCTVLSRCCFVYYFHPNAPEAHKELTLCQKQFTNHKQMVLLGAPKQSKIAKNWNRLILASELNCMLNAYEPIEIGIHFLLQLATV